MSTLSDYASIEILGSTPEDVLKAAKVLQSMINDFLPDEALRFMINDMWDQFSTAPASSKLKYHGSFQGGLLVHSVNLTLSMLKLSTTGVFVGKEEVIPKSICTSGMLHDFGKAGLKGIPYYLPEESDWHRNNLGRMYRHNDELGFFSELDMTLYQLMNYGVKLTRAEYQAVRYQDGAWDFNFRERGIATAENLFPLTLLLHTSDMVASRFYKT